jgi:hypothetical protein
MTDIVKVARKYFEHYKKNFEFGPYNICELSKRSKSAKKW